MLERLRSVQRQAHKQQTGTRGQCATTVGFVHPRAVDSLCTSHPKTMARTRIKRAAHNGSFSTLARLMARQTDDEVCICLPLPAEWPTTGVRQLVLAFRAFVVRNTVISSGAWCVFHSTATSSGARRSVTYMSQNNPCRAWLGGVELGPSSGLAG